ncbi:hypothetical protein E2C01_056743 [Portunus trituberculatus]|uniref:Uncharacterized protein n=1 Tax=Portunus trituberculatus TaxID=210409 RepID=A0A5B7H1F5_PORTR|nr:hypothetical protein [Portunus trituberculatus]
MEYALEYADKPDTFWDRVVFCDEKTFSTDDPAATQYVWHTPTTRFQACNVIANKRSGRVTVGMFGWMHAGGVGQLADVGPGPEHMSVLDEATQLRLTDAYYILHLGRITGLPTNG